MVAKHQQDKSRREQPAENADATDNTEQTFLSHLIELRDRLMRSVLVVLVIFLSLFYFANDLYGLLAQPLLQYLPEGQKMLATSVISPFLTPFKLTLVLSVFVSMPFLLYQLWAFVAPGLYKHEKNLAKPLLFSSIVLFYAGMAFAYYVVFPLLFRFMANLITDMQGVAYAPDITQYLDTVLKLFFAFGIAFEVPIATIILIATGLTTAESLAKKRPYIIVGAFVIGMLLTPPDIISQTLLALPMWILFELGLIFSKVLLKQPQEESIAPSGASASTAAATTIPDDSHLINEDELEEDVLDLYEDDEFEELSEAEMEAELDKAIADEEKLSNATDADSPAKPENDGSATDTQEDGQTDKKD